MSPILYGTIAINIVSIVLNRINSDINFDSVLNTKSNLIKLTVESAFSSINGAFCIRSFVYLTSKCISALPTSPAYLLFLLPPIIIPRSGNKLSDNYNTIKKIFVGIEKANKEKKPLPHLGESLFFCSDLVVGNCIGGAARISHFGLLYLLRPAITAHPVLFGISLLSSIITTGQMINNAFTAYRDLENVTNFKNK